MINLSTKYKVVIVNVVVIGLLLCGQYWIYQKNQVDSKKIILPEAFEDLKKKVQAIQNGESDSEHTFEFEDIDGEHFYFEVEGSSKKFTCYVNGSKQAINSEFTFIDVEKKMYNVHIKGNEVNQPKEKELYIRPIEEEAAKVYEWLKNLKTDEGNKKDTTIKFKTIHDFYVTFEYTKQFNLHAKVEWSEWEQKHKTKHEPLIFFKEYCQKIEIDEYLNGNYSLKITSKVNAVDNQSIDKKENIIYTEPKKIALNYAQKQSQESLQQKIQTRKMYQTLIWIFIVILLLCMIIFVIFYDEEEKNFVFTTIMNEDECETTDQKYIQDGSNNA